MKTLKQSVSIVLSAILIFSLLPLSASAETEGYYTYSVTNGEATITDVDESISGNITIPAVLGGYPVTSIGWYAFQWCKNLESATIPNSVTYIGVEAFFGCENIISINIPGSVTSIGKSAFSRCSNLKSLTIPHSVETIADSTFSYCSNIENITIPDSVTSINDCVFECCSNLRSITIPDTVTHIGALAFLGCNTLTDVYYSGSEKQWGMIEISKYENDAFINATIHYNYVPSVNVFFEDSDRAIISGENILVDAGLGTEGLLSQASKGTVLKSKDGNPVTSEALPATGMIIELSDLTQYTIVVPGDVDCDGAVLSSDARLALRASVGLENFKEKSAQYMAANVASEDTLSAADARLILRASVGLEDSKVWIK